MYYIVTPTFRGHFQYIKKYLKSFKRYVKDPENVEICFTISEDEIEDFQEIIKPYINNINIKICIFDKILKEFHVPFNANELLDRYGRFTFQTLKKFYTILYINAERSLILDSESMWIAPVVMKDCFDNFFDNPFITVSDIYGRKWDEFTQVEISNINYLLSSNCEVWPLENFIWFYDINILKNLINEHGSLFQMAEKIYWKNRHLLTQPGIFEIVLYQNYIYLNCERYNYKVINIDKDIKHALGNEKFNQYMRMLYKKYGGACGVAEHITEFLTNDTWERLSQVMINNHQNIIRCDNSESIRAYIKQRKFMKLVNPCILAASQGNFFGINQNIWHITNCILKKNILRITNTFRQKFSSLYRKISPIYRLSIETRNNIWRLEGAINWRIDNLERKLYSSPNPLSDSYLNWILNLSKCIVERYPKNWFNNKKILLVDCGYGDIANTLERLGALIYVADRRSECCDISEVRVSRIEKSIVLRESDGGKDFIKELASNAPYDLIIDFGMMFYDDMQNILNWEGYTDRLLFFVCCINHKGEKLYNEFLLDEENTQNLLDGYSNYILEELQKKEWSFVIGNGIINNHFNYSKTLILCDAKKEQKIKH